MSKALIIPSQAFPAFNHMTDEECGQILRRAIDYVLTEHEDYNREEKGAVAVTWSILREQIRICSDKYEKACAQRREAANSRWHPDGPHFPRKMRPHPTAQRTEANAL
jgi:hypothetical protein